MIRILDGLEDVCEDITQKMCGYLAMERPILKSLNIEDRVCELMAFKIARVMGIRCQYNYKNELINFFASIIGDVVLERLGFRITVAKHFRYVKYNGLNFEREISNIFSASSNVDNAIIASVQFLEQHKVFVPEMRYLLRFKQDIPVFA